MDDMIRLTTDFVKGKLGSDTGHDWWHVYRVWKSAKHIGEVEGADTFIVQLAALLHDIGDWKVTGAKDNSSSEASEFLRQIGVDRETTMKVADIIDNMSFSSNISGRKELSLEGKVVQDADRLDAIGAIGVARTFATGARRGKEIHNPEIKPLKYATPEEYRKGKSTCINHFHEKLFLLKDLMNTKTGRELAHGRHAFMESYIGEFMKEWEMDG